jgi:hypothetical protein
MARASSLVTNYSGAFGPSITKPTPNPSEEGNWVLQKNPLLGGAGVG